MIKTGRNSSVSISRRNAIKGAALGAGVAALAAAGGGRMAQAQSARRTFVLIHGAWHGGWCWRPVADILEAKGHKVYAPSLTGLADRSHLLSMSINLDTHIADIVNLFKWEDIENAVPRRPFLRRLADLGRGREGLPARSPRSSIVDAFMPENGQKGMDLSSAQFQAALREAIAKGEAGRPVPKAEAFKIIDPKNVAWVQAKMTPQPTGLATSPIVLTGARDRIAKKTYIRAAEYPQPNFDTYLAATKADKSWRTFEFKASEAGHDIMVDAPQRLAEILMEVA